MILWGPPGVGKTTLARLMADAFDAEFIASAVFSGVKDIREAVARAEATRAERARPSCSSTRCTASTRRSRTPSCPVEGGPADAGRRDDREPVVRGQFGAACARLGLCPQSLSEDEMGPVVRTRLRQGLAGPTFDDDARARAPDRPGRRRRAAPDQPARADAHWRRQTAKSRTVDGASSTTRWRRACAVSTRAARPSTTRFSALHKSVRGSNPDAALYWFCRMLDGGRPALSRPAHRAHGLEDIGLADPRAAQVAASGGETQSASARRRRTGAGRSGDLSGHGCQIERRLRRV